VNRHTVVLQKISAKMAKYFPLLGRCEQLWPLLLRPETCPLVFCRRACVQPGRAPRLPRARPRGAASTLVSPRGFGGPWSPEEELHDSPPQGRPFQQPSHGGDRAAPEASRSSTLGPSAPSGGKLRGPQPGWPGTPLSPLTCSAVHSGPPSGPRGSCCSGGGPGATWAARAGKVR